MKNKKNNYLACFLSLAFLCSSFAYGQTSENAQTAPSNIHKQHSTEKTSQSPLEETPPVHNGFSSSTIETPKNDDTYFFYQLLNMLFALVSIILLILIASWILKRMMNTRIQQINTNSRIKIVERRSLTPKTAIYLLEVSDRDIVIAESGNGVTLLSYATEKPLPQASDFEKILNEKNP